MKAILLVAESGTSQSARFAKRWGLSSGAGAAYSKAASRGDGDHDASIDAAWGRG